MRAVEVQGADIDAPKDPADLRTAWAALESAWAATLEIEAKYDA